MIKHAFAEAKDYAWVLYTQVRDLHKASFDIITCTIQVGGFYTALILSPLPYTEEINSKGTRKSKKKNKCRSNLFTIDYIILNQCYKTKHVNNNTITTNTKKNE